MPRAPASSKQATPNGVDSSATSTTVPSSGSSGCRSRCGFCERSSETDQDQQLARRLDEADAELHRAVAELRDLAHGIHPVVLSDEGLAAAVDRWHQRRQARWNDAS